MTDREKLDEIKDASKDAFKIPNIDKEADKTYSVSTSSNSNNTKEENYVEKLKALQENLQKEASKNPEIKLTDEYKKLQEKYEQIVNGKKSDENKLESLEKQNLEENPSESNVEIKETLLVDSTEEKQEETTKLNFENIKKDLTEENQEEATESTLENEKDDLTEENQEENKDLDLTENKEDVDLNESSTAPSLELKEEETSSNAEEKIVSFEEMYKQLFGKEPYGGRKQETENKQESFYTFDSNIDDSNVSIFEDNASYSTIQYKFIGIAFNTYIILEINDELYIMDQHAAHERIMYEKVKKNFYSQEEKDSQLLLLPDIIELTNKEMDIAKDNLNLFRQAGFIVEEFGDNTIKLSGVPNVCVDLNTADLFKETLDEINTVARTAKQEKEEKFIATIACKSAVKANMKLEKEEVDKLMESLLQLPNPFTCPHGRPTVIKMSKYEIERKFARK